MDITYVRFKYIWRPWTLPATVACSNKPNGSKGGSYHLSPRWRDAVRYLNTEHAINYIFKPRSGWVNAMADDGTPIIELVAFAGNIARATRFQKGYYLLDSLQPGDPTPNSGDFLHVHRFTCVDPLMRPRQPGDGFDAWVYLLSDGPMWVHQSKVDAFRNPPPPILPGSGFHADPKYQPKRKKREDRE
jgi:hypothetical protein